MEQHQQRHSLGDSTLRSSAPQLFSVVSTGQLQLQLECKSCDPTHSSSPPASCHPPPASFPSACIKNELNLMLRCLATTGVVSSSASVLVPLQVRCPRSCLAVPLCTPSGAHCDMQQESTASARNSIYTNFSNVSSLQNLLLDRKDFSSE